MSVVQIIESMIEKANTTTGKTDSELTSAIQSLVDGFGIGESESDGQLLFFTKCLMGEFTQDVNEYFNSSPKTIYHGLGEIPKLVLIWDTNAVLSESPQKHFICSAKNSILQDVEYIVTYGCRNGDGSLTYTLWSTGGSSGNETIQNVTETELTIKPYSTVGMAPEGHTYKWLVFA